MVKETKVKWALGGDEPEDLAEFLSNEDIVKKNTEGKGKSATVNWPGKGPFRVKVRFLKVKPNKNGDDRISTMVVIDQPKGEDGAEWNGYAMFDGFNVTEQGAPYIKRFLKGLGLQWSDFMDKTKKDDSDPPQITQIAGVKFGPSASKDVYANVMVKVKPADDYNDDEHMEVSRWIPSGDEDESSSDDSGDEAVADFSGGKAGKKDKGKKKKGKKGEPPF